MYRINTKKTGAKIKHYMDLRGFDATDVQEECMLTTRNAIYRWIKGQYLPSIENLVTLAMMFGVKLEDLLVVEE